MTTTKKLARLAGLLYLTVAVLGGLPQLYIRPSVRVAGDAAATAAHVAAETTLMRVGFVGELVALTSFLLLAMALYMLLKHVNRHAAAAMVTFVAVAVAVMSANMINHLAAVMLVTDTSLAAAGPDSLALLFLELHAVGYSIAEIFFGLWLLPLGYLAYRSGYFPRALGVLLMVGCFAYLTLALAVPLFDGLPEVAIWIIAAPAAVAEFWMLGYLLVRGVKSPQPVRHDVVAA